MVAIQAYRLRTNCDFWQNHPKTFRSVSTSSDSNDQQILYLFHRKIYQGYSIVGVSLSQNRVHQNLTTNHLVSPFKLLYCVNLPMFKAKNTHGVPIFQTKCHRLSHSTAIFKRWRASISDNIDGGFSGITYEWAMTWLCSS